MESRESRFPDRSAEKKARSVTSGSSFVSIFETIT
jgi:hypothetical protein